MVSSYEEVVDFLYRSLPVFQHIGPGAYKPGLEQIEELSAELGFPHKKFSSIHVAGTNGKGSVSHMLASVLHTAGYRVGLFTSPHLKDFRERIRVQGEMISEEAVVEFVTRNRPLIERQKASFFEVTTAMAFDHFARMEVDVAVIETGMGGRLDATNVIRPRLSVITNISHDHGQFLGDTLEQIASEKAGIIKEMTPVVVGESQLESQLTFITRAKECSAPLLFADQMYRVVSQTPLPHGQRFELENRMDGERFSLELDLGGAYQRKNIITLLAALDLLNGSGGFPVSREAVERGLAQVTSTTGLRGRWQVLSQSPLTVCDTGHNEDGLREVVAQIAQQSYRRLFMVLGFVADKELDRVLPLLPQDGHYLFTRAQGERSLDPQKLSEAASTYGLRGEVHPSVGEALTAARSQAEADDLIFVGGSTFVVAELF